LQVWQPGTERKASKKYFLIAMLTQYFVCEVDRKLASCCKQEILIFKLGKSKPLSVNAVLKWWFSQLLCLIFSITLIV